MIDWFKKMTPEEAAKFRTKGAKFMIIPFTIIIIFAMVLVFSTVQKSSNKQKLADDIQNNNSPQQKSETTSIKPIFEGTYKGKFNYFYKVRGTYIYRDEYRSDCVKPEGWIAATINLRVTFKKSTTPFEYTVTKLWIDNPDFNTGSNGIVPMFLNGKPYHINLPDSPTSANDSFDYNIFFETPSANVGTTKRNCIGIVIWSPEGYYASPDGNILHSNPHTPTDQYDDTISTWSARTTDDFGLFSWNSLEKYCHTKTISWSLTKISD